jgi:hypothetical protein
MPCLPSATFTVLRPKLISSDPPPCYCGPGNKSVRELTEYKIPHIHPAPTLEKRPNDKQHKTAVFRAVMRWSRSNKATKSSVNLMILPGLRMSVRNSSLASSVVTWFCHITSGTIMS